MFRRYNISIIINENAPQIASNFPMEFGCTISDPSNWIERGLTEERGLTFVDPAGEEITSPIFKHQPYFNLRNEKEIKEKEEIKALIYSSLREHYSLGTDEVSVVVEEYTSL
jgi:hypothetical protein